MYPYPGAPLFLTHLRGLNPWSRSIRELAAPFTGWFAPMDWSQNRTCVFRSHPAPLPGPYSPLVHEEGRRPSSIRWRGGSSRGHRTVLGLCWMASTIERVIYIIGQKAVGWGSSALLHHAGTAAPGRHAANE